MAKDKEETEATNQPPVMSFRDGELKVAVWERKGEKGTFYNVSIERSYFDEKAKEFKPSSSIPFRQLLALGSLLAQAHAWIREKRTEKK